MEGGGGAVYGGQKGEITLLFMSVENIGGKSEVIIGCLGRVWVCPLHLDNYKILKHKKQPTITLLSRAG